MEQCFDAFSVLFAKGEVCMSGKYVPLGQCTTDILNLDSTVLDQIEEKIRVLVPEVELLFYKKNRQHRSLRTGEIERCLGFDFSFAGLPGFEYGAVCLL